MIPAGLNLMLVTGLPYPRCPEEAAPGNPCTSYWGHEPCQSPSGPHWPKHNLQAKKPDGPAFDPLRMRA